MKSFQLHLRCLNITPHLDRSLEVAAGASGSRKLGRYRKGQQRDSSTSGPDQVVTPTALPIDPLDLTSSTLPGQFHYGAAEQYAVGLPSYIDPSQYSSSSYSSSRSGTAGRSGKPTSTRHDGRRGSLLKFRVAPRRSVAAGNMLSRGSSSGGVQCTRMPAKSRV